MTNYWKYGEKLRKIYLQWECFYSSQYSVFSEPDRSTSQILQGQKRLNDTMIDRIHTYRFNSDPTKIIILKSCSVTKLIMYLVTKKALINWKSQVLTEHSLSSHSNKIISCWYFSAGLSPRSMCLLSMWLVRIERCWH